MDTLGNLLDKQLTAVMKLNFTSDEDKVKNLSTQLDCLTEEINDVSEKILTGKMKPEDSMRPQHKTY